MRRRFRPQNFILLLGLLCAAVLAFPVVKSNLPRLAPVAQRVGERLALFSALCDLPDQSKTLLERRFAGQIAEEAPAEPTPAPTPVPAPSPEAARAEPTPAPASPAATPQQEKESPPEIPAPYRGKMIEEDMSGAGSSNCLGLSPGYLRNYTDLAFGEIGDILADPPGFTVDSGEAPQVLIFHTHATEAFERYDSDTYDTRNNWRSTDNNMNMVAVGDALAASLEENGIRVVHDTTQHDYPSYNGAYDLSAATIRRYQEQYPGIKVMFDVHRDAIDRDGTLVRPVVTIDGRKAAQLMIIAPCDDGTMDIPAWRENLRFAAAITRQVETDHPRLMRPIFFGYRKYNFNKAPGSLLLEFGSHGNTLEECVYTAQLVGRSVAEAIKGLM